MSVEMMLYLAGLSSSLSILSFVVGVPFFIFSIMIYIISLEDDEYKYKKTAINFAIVSSILVLFGSFLPSEKTCNMMLAARVSKEIISSSPIPEKLLRLINQKLDDQIKDEK